MTSRYLHSKTPDLWTYRDILALLRSLDREMIEVLRVAMSRLEGFIRSGNWDSVGTEFDFDDVVDEDTMVWRVAHPVIGTRHLGERHVKELGRGPVVRRLITALAGSSAGLFTGNARVNPPQFSREIVNTRHSVL